MMAITMAEPRATWPESHRPVQSKSPEGATAGGSDSGIEAVAAAAAAAVTGPCTLHRRPHWAWLLSARNYKTSVRAWSPPWGAGAELEILTLTQLLGLGWLPVEGKARGSKWIPLGLQGAAHVVAPLGHTAWSAALLAQGNCCSWGAGSTSCSLGAAGRQTLWND